MDPKFAINWDKEEIDQYIYSLYPEAPLELVGFRLAKLDRQNKIIPITYDNVENLRNNVNQSKIVIIPNRDLPLPSRYTQLNEGGTMDSVNESGSTSRVNQRGRTVGANQRETPDRGTTAYERGNTSRVHQRVTTVRRNEIEIPDRATMNQRRETTDSINQIETRQLQEDLVIDPDNFNVMDNYNDRNDAFVPVIPVMDAEAEIITITVTRANCVSELLNYYEDVNITEKNLSVSFRDEVGVDGGGLTKELFNLFFKQVENVYFHGEDCLVPFLPLNRVRKDKEKYIIIGRILEHMLLLTGSIPSKLSKVTLLLVGNPSAEINQNMLLDEFYNFVNPCERYILKKSVSNFPALSNTEMDILRNIFNSYHFYEMPSQEEITEQVTAIATNTLYEVPKQFIEMMRQGIQVGKYTSFWTKCDFATLIDMQKPTPNKVANCLKVEDNLTNEQSNVLHFLEMYIRCLDEEKILQLVFLVTGSYQMPDFLKIEFTDLVGLAQRPTFSTCTNTVYIPSTYSTYQQLKNDFDLCLNSEEAYIYNAY